MAACTTSALALGDHPDVTAFYEGDTGYAQSTSSALDQVVNQASTTTITSSSPNPSVYGQDVTLSATVVAVSPGAGTPTGSVTFYANGVSLGSANLNGSGDASFDTTSLAVGTDSITATYGGDTNFNSSTSTSSDQVVNQADTSTTVTSSVNPSVFGQSVTFTATVSAASPGSGTPTGSVTFYDGTTSLGSNSLNGSGVATLSTSALLAGSHTISAVYGGDGNFLTSTSSNLTQTVNQASTDTVVTANADPDDGGSVTLTATVSAVAPGSGTPTGNVTFMDGGTTLGVEALSGGVATYTGSFSVSEYTISATYGGDSNFLTSSGSLVTLVNQNFNAVAGVSTGPVQVGTIDDYTGGVLSDPVTIVWGDGSSSAGAIVSLGGDDYGVTGTHTYASSGAYTVQTNLTLPDHTLSSSATATVSSSSMAATAGSLSTDPTQSFLLPVGQDSIDIGQGAVRASQSLDFSVSDEVRAGQSFALVYNGATITQTLMVQATLPISSSLGVPTSIVATLTVDGTAQSPVTFSTTGHLAGDTYLLALQAPVSGTGLHTWEIDFQVNLSGGTILYETSSGSAIYVDQSSSVFGAGWGLQGLDQLYLVSGGVLWVTGTGDTRLFTGSGGTYTNPEDFGTLVQTGSGASLGFTYTAPDQTKEYFSVSHGSTQVFDESRIVDSDDLTTAFAYDSSDDLTQVVAPDGSTTTLLYSGGGSPQVTSIIEPGSRTVGLAYSGADMTLLTDEAGNTRAFTYDGGNHMTSDQWDPYSTSFSYDALGYLTLVDQGSGITTTFAPQIEQGTQTAPALNSSANVAKVTDGLSDTTTYQLDELDRLTLEQAPRGGTQSWDLDEHGDLTLAVDEFGQSTSYAYDTEGDLTEEADPDGSTAQYAYDPTFHQVTQEIDYPAGGRQSTTSYTYDPSTGDPLTAVTDPATAAAATTTYAWNNGLLTLSTDPDGNSTSYAYDSQRQLTLVLDYDATGHQVNSQSYTYDSAGHVQNTLTANSKTVDVINAIGELLSETVYPHTGTSVISFMSETFLAAGLVATTTDGDNNVTSESYNSAGLVTEEKTTDPGSNTIGDVSATYNAAAEVSTQSDGVGDTTSYGYDADGNVTQTLTKNGSTTEYQSTTSYDDEDNPTLITDGDGNFTTISYYAGLPTLQEVYDLGSDSPLSTQSWGYDSDQNQTLFIDADGNTTTSTFDAHGHMTGETLINSSGATLATQNWSYDGSGDLTECDDADAGTTVDSYDGAGAVTQTSGDAAVTSSTSYDQDGNVTKFVDGDSNTTSSVYDDNLLIKQMVYNSAGSLVSSMTMSYDQDQRQTELIDADGNTTMSLYDAAGDMTQQVVYDSLGDPFSTLSQAYDKAGNVTFASNSLDGSTTASSYDGDQLTLQTIYEGGTTSTQSWSYDAAGEVTSSIDAQSNTITSTYANGNQVAQQVSKSGSQIDNETWSYDTAGNLTSYLDNDGNVTSSTYDGDGRMIQQVVKAGSTTLSSESLVYDGDSNVLTDTLAYATNGGTQTQVSSSGYDGEGNQTLAIEAAGTTLAATTLYGYDAKGQETEVLEIDSDSPPTTNTTSFEYDARGNQTLSVSPTGYTTTMQYDGDNNLTAEIDADGRLQLIGYDAFGRETSDVWYAGSTTTSTQLESITMAYDPDGNLTLAANSYGAYSLNYDPEGELTQVVEPVGVTLSMGYDSNSNRTLLADSLGGTIQSTYDPNNELTTEVYSQGGTTVARIDQQYDWQGRVVSRKDSSNAAGTSLVASLTSGYNAEDQVTQLNETGGALDHRQLHAEL